MESWRLKLLPLVREPVGQFTSANSQQVRQQLHEIQLWVQIVSATGAGKAGQDRGRSPAARISYEQTVLAIENYGLHLVLPDIVSRYRPHHPEVVVEISRLGKAIRDYESGCLSAT